MEEGYSLRILRVNLSTGKIGEEDDRRRHDPEVPRRHGPRDQVPLGRSPCGVEWSDPDNRISFFTGPLAGTRMSGSGTFSVTTKGACTDMAGTSQANGFFGAFMRFNGIDGILVEGAAKKWTRLHIRDGKIELVDAEHLLGKDTWETEDAVKAGDRQEVQRLQHRSGRGEPDPFFGDRRRPRPRGCP